jgi:O-methyltransferase
MLSDQLLNKYPIISDQVEIDELRIILSELEKVLQKQVPGSVVEFGCYVGTTSLFLQRLLVSVAPERTLYVYDSFQGLPEKTANDQSPAGEQFQAGKLYASKQTFIKNFKKAGLPLPIIHKGWFEDIQMQHIPERIAFAFLDGDYFQSIHSSLGLIEGKLSPGSIVIVDDYQSEALPGAKKALDLWLKNKIYTLATVHSLAVIRIVS